jgi:CRP-like cAMP-binding protein
MKIKTTITDAEAIDIVIRFLKSIAPLSHKLETSLRELLVIETLPRKHRLLRYGEISDRVYFIVEGLVRAFHLDENRWERTDWIMTTSDVIIGVDSFYTREPGEEDIETLEPTIVGSITYAELEMLYDKFIGFNRIGRILNQEYNIRARKRAKELGILDATVRYEVFKERYPEFVDRVPAKYIASYIGVDETTLSRIKNGNYNNPRKQ